MSRKQGGRPKGTKNDNKILTEISIDNYKNEITAILYKNKIELYGKKFPVGLPQKNIYEVSKTHNLPNDHNIMITLISQRIVTAKQHVPYGQGSGFPYPLLKIEDEV